MSRCIRELKVKVPRAELRKLTNINGLIDLLHRVLPANPTAVVAQTGPPFALGAESRTS